MDQAGEVVDVYRQTRRDAEAAQRFLSAHAVVYSLFNPQRQLVSAAFYRLRRARAFVFWKMEVAA